MVPTSSPGPVTLLVVLAVVGGGVRARGCDVRFPGD